MRVLQPGHELRLSLEAADELRMVGVLRLDDLDGDLSTDRRLIRPMHRTEVAFGHLGAQLVATDQVAADADRSGRGSQRLILLQHLELEIT